MRPEDVPAELVEKAARAIHASQCCPLDKDSQCYGWPINLEEETAGHALAAVLPEIQAQALRDEADRTHTYEFSTGDVVEHVHDEYSRSLMRNQAARKTATTEEPTS